MPPRHEGVGWDATSSREIEIKWEGFLLFPMGGGMAIFAFAMLLQS